MDKYAAAYIRRSSISGDNPGDASREAQEAAVRRLCGDDVHLFADWGISGRRNDRPEYVRLKAAIEAGEVASVCAYSLSRLGRNARELLAFIETCGAHAVPVRTAVESIDTSTAMGRAMLTVMAAFAQLEVEQGMERSAAAREARKTRSEAAGVRLVGSSPVYGFRHVRGEDGVYRRELDPDQPIGPILDAYREAGSILGACKVLRERGIPAPKGGERWATSALTRIIEAHAPELLPRRTVAGRRSPTSALLAQLVRCPFCETMMTPNATRRQLYCRNGAYDREHHPRYVATERNLLPWIKAEAARLRVPHDAVRLADSTAALRASAGAALERAQRLYIRGDLGEAVYAEETARARRELAEADAAADAIAAIPKAIDWKAPAEAVNAVLRRLWRHVELDADMRPTSASWVIPEWRA